MPHSDPQARSEVFKKSPWSWIPERNHGAFKGQDEIDVREHGVHATDQHVSPNVKRPVHCELEQEARDRMIRVVTKVADSRLCKYDERRIADHFCQLSPSRKSAGEHKTQPS